MVPGAVHGDLSEECATFDVLSKDGGFVVEMFFKRETERVSVERNVSVAEEALDRTTCDTQEDEEVDGPVGEGGTGVLFLEPGFWDIGGGVEHVRLHAGGQL